MTRIKMISSLAIAAATLLMACGNSTNNNNDSNEEATPVVEKNVTAAEYDFRIVASHTHATDSYTQGLEYVDGVMWEGTGREGKSHLQRIDLASGKYNIVASLPNDEFGEGITHFGDRIYQLTWLSEKAYVYDLKGNIIKTIPYKGEGWGITTDGTRLFLSDGTSLIRQVNPETFATEGVISVTLNGSSLELINELEWIEGSIWANVYLTDYIVEIDPATGKIVGYADLAPLRELLKGNPEAEAMNGIAYNAATKHFYVTGKDWNRLFELEIIK
ncbi:MAG: glutaminyl-peptide cyclotransferase [Alistipes sp.]|nr:glutaminyl-peptide cyclotransferase [Alistipes sp.]